VGTLVTTTERPRKRRSSAAAWQRRARSELTAQLMLEYAGSLPPGQVVAAVARAGAVLGTAEVTEPALWRSMCESLARNRLAESVALLPRAERPRPGGSPASAAPPSTQEG
jgi:hypothetical protein